MRIHMSEHTMTDDRITHGCNKYIDLPIRSVTHRTSYPSGLTRPLCLGEEEEERESFATEQRGRLFGISRCKPCCAVTL